MNNINILWADDEIDLLKPHVLYLENKGYKLSTVNSGLDALEMVQKNYYDLVFLDENMPGLSGLETLSKIKELKQDLPIVMITKNEEEHIMEDAIGSKIADYLIKPINPSQIVLTIKRILDHKKLVNQKTTNNYMQEFRNLGLTINDQLTIEEWKETYKKLTFWELELDNTEEESLKEVFENQKNDANLNFCKYISQNYTGFLQSTGDFGPVMSHNLLRRKVFSLFEENKPIFFILIDNLRFDHWKSILPIISEKFRVQNEDLYLSILPTSTQYCRNSIFAGLLPSDIEKRFPNKWSNDEDEGGKNLFEEDFLKDLMQRLRKEVKTSYTKITNLESGKELIEKMNNLLQNKLNVIVYNFVDSLSHARTDVHVVRELAEDEAAYRSITASWFKHSPLWEAILKLVDKDIKIIITTDHGAIRVKNPIKIIGDKNTNTNLRYKQGKSLSYNAKEVYEIKKTEQAFLPKQHISTSFVFAKNSDFFAYPNNYNYYVNYYKNTFQHGGISLEEMLIPFIEITNK